MSQTAETAIANLVYRYAECIDDGDFAGVAGLFAGGCVVGPDGHEACGFDEVLALYRGAARIYADTGTPRTQHVTTNLIIELDTGRRAARARSYFTVFQAVADFPLQAIIAGRYRDEFQLRDGEWCFRRREICPRLTGNLERHLLFDPADMPAIDKSQ
jgi:3-phenylpropionate/cinnamic acid dioxygenase small subunit